MEPKRECRCKAFKKAPHFFKPLQVVISIGILISVLTAFYTYTDPLWQTALASLLISGAATIIFFLGIQHSLVQRYSCGKLTWNAAEFIYSLVLLYFCVDSTVFAIGRITWYYGSIIPFIICGVLFILLFISYLVPLLYIAREELKILMEKREVVKAEQGTVRVHESKPDKVAESASDLESLLEH